MYAFNDLKTAPYSSFIGVRSSESAQVSRLVGPSLQGLEGDFVFDAQLVPGTANTLIKLGDPAVRANNPYNSYRLWQWNRRTNTLTMAAPRALFFRQVASAPGGGRVAYIAGGDALGQTPEENGGFSEPLRLFVYDAQSKKEKLVSTSSGVRGGFKWLDANALLYTAIPTPIKKTDSPKAVAQPNIYAFDFQSGKSKLLVRAARYLLPSPNGKHIAFWGLRPGSSGMWSSYAQTSTLHRVPASLQNQRAKASLAKQAQISRLF